MRCARSPPGQFVGGRCGSRVCRTLGGGGWWRPATWERSRSYPGRASGQSHVPDLERCFMSDRGVPQMRTREAQRS